MKNSIKKICLLAIVLLIISASVVLIMGNTYTVSFDYNNGNHTLNVEENKEAIEIIEEKVENSKYLVAIKAKKPGKVFLNMDYGDYAEQKLLYVHKTMIITDNNFFGYSRGSEIIPISISILLIYILIQLIRRYRYYVKENLYQYKNVAYLGIIIFLSIFILNNLLSIINYHGIFDTVSRVINSMSAVSSFLLPIALVTFIIVAISNLKLLIKEGKSLHNLLGFTLSIFICLSAFLPEFVYRILSKSQAINIYNLNSIGPYLYNFVETSVYLVVAYLECILIGTIIIALKSVRKKVKYDKDYMIILGCQIRKDGTLTPLLKGRVDKALEFRNKQLKKTGKDLIFIPSGGKGSDESLSEAEAIKNYLLEKGIKEKSILIDDKSKNTYENIKFSNELIDKKNANVAFSTTNYHVFRAGLIAKEQGLNLEGIGSKTKAYFWINAFVREFVGTLYSERKKHIIVFSTILLIIILMISITYFANNI